MTAPKKKDHREKRPDDHAGTPRNEGEGNRTAAKAYNDATHTFVESGKPAAAAKEAERAVSTPEAEELTAAEAKGRARARH